MDVMALIAFFHKKWWSTLNKMHVMALLDLYPNKTTYHYHFLLAVDSSTNLPRMSPVSATFSFAHSHKRNCAHRLQPALQYWNFSDIIDSKSASADRSLTVSRGILRLAGLWPTLTIGTSSEMPTLKLASWRDIHILLIRKETFQ